VLTITSPSLALSEAVLISRLLLLLLLLLLGEARVTADPVALSCNMIGEGSGRENEEEGHGPTRRARSSAGMRRQGGQEQVARAGT